MVKRNPKQNPTYFFYIFYFLRMEQHTKNYSENAKLPENLSFKWASNICIVASSYSRTKTSSYIRLLWNSSPKIKGKKILDIGTD